MPIIKYREKMNDILRKSVFTLGDLHNKGISQNYAKKLLHVLEKNKKIKRIERGKYTCLDDPIVIAAHITEPCYLSLWTAMSIRKLTQQVPFSVEVVTSRRRFKKRIDFLGTPIIFRIVNPKMMFGYENIVWKENIRIAVANIEKIVIDLIVFNGPEDEILKLIEQSNVFRLKEYAKLTENEKIINKIKMMIR